MSRKVIVIKNQPKSSNLWKWLLGGGALAGAVYYGGKFAAKKAEETFNKIEFGYGGVKNIRNRGLTIYAKLGIEIVNNTGIKVPISRIYTQLYYRDIRIADVDSDELLTVEPVRTTILWVPIQMSVSSLVQAGIQDLLNKGTDPFRLKGTITAYKYNYSVDIPYTLDVKSFFPTLPPIKK